MQSTVFIVEAKALIKDIQAFELAYLDRDEEIRQSDALQKRITQAFISLQNPTLPSAYNLRDAAYKAGFQLDHARMQALGRFENIR